MKNLISIVVTLVILAASMLAAYNLGVRHAVTAEGFLDVTEDGVEVFVLEVGEDYYVWDVSEG